MAEVISKSVRDTEALAKRLGATLEPGAVLALAGELGAGKTAFVRGLAAGLGVDPAQVTSPTYGLVHEYVGGRVILVHIDLYRLAGADDARALGIEEQLHRRDAVVAVEWADRLPELLPEGAAWIRLQRLEGDERRVELQRLAPPASNRRRGGRPPRR